MYQASFYPCILSYSSNDVVDCELVSGVEKGRRTGKERDGLLSASFSLFVAWLLDMTII